MKKYYLFLEQGVTDMFFCGEIKEALPTDNVPFHSDYMTYDICAELLFCKVFDTKKEAQQYKRLEQKAMEESNKFAFDAMDSEDYYGVEGVDDMRFEN